MAGSASQNRVPQRRVGRLFSRSKEEDAIRSEELVNAGQQRSPGALRKIDHDVAKKDDIESLMKGQRRLAKICMAESAELADLGFGDPVFANVVEVAHNVARGKTAVHLDAVVKAVTGSVDDFVTDVGALDVDVPSG